MKLAMESPETIALSLSRPDILSRTFRAMADGQYLKTASGVKLDWVYRIYSFCDDLIKQNEPQVNIPVNTPSTAMPPPKTRQSSGKKGGGKHFVKKSSKNRDDNIK